MRRAAAFLLGLVVAAIVVAGLWRAVDPWHREPVDWSLVGTAGDGKTVVVGFVSTYKCMRDIRARIVEAGPREIDVVVDAEVRDCDQQSEPFLWPARVAVEGGVRGRPIRGATRSLRPFVMTAGRERVLPSEPDVRGLNVLDARAVAAALGYDLRLANPNSLPRSQPVSRQIVGRGVIKVSF